MPNSTLKSGPYTYSTHYHSRQGDGLIHLLTSLGVTKRSEPTYTSSYYRAGDYVTISAGSTTLAGGTYQITNNTSSAITFTAPSTGTYSISYPAGYTIKLRPPQALIQFLKQLEVTKANPYQTTINAGTGNIKVTLTV